MKNILSKPALLMILICLFTQSLFSQGFDSISSKSSPSFIESSDYLFQYLNKDKLQTGVLYDRVYNWSNALNINERDSLDRTHTQQIWHEMYLATYDKSNILSILDADKISRHNQVKENVISIGYIHYAYETIDSNAFIDGRLIYGTDSLYFDGNALNPYNSNRISLPVIFANKISTPTVTFLFDERLKLNNINGDFATRITLKFSNGDLLILSPNQKKEYTFPKSRGGHNFINIEAKVEFNIGPPSKFIFSLENGLNKTTSSVTTGTCVSSLTAFFTPNTLMFQGYGESIPTQGQGEYKIFYHLQDAQGTNCEMKLKKPIIMLDGFDPLDERKIIGDAIDKGIWELLEYDFVNNVATKHLGDELRLKGYDVLILNFPSYIIPGTTTLRDGGADYMERNALILETLINEVNNQLSQNGSSEKIVIIGPSMGGQISRYALKDMENKGQNHNCRLWVAFDSPNLGANIPIGLQTLMWYAAFKAGKADALLSYNTKIRSIAGRQLLIHQSGDDNGNFPLLSEPYHSIWQNSINSLGYPSNLKKVALINGTTAGQWRQSCSNMIDYTAKKSSNPLQGLLFTSLSANCLPDYGNNNCSVFKGFLLQPLNYTTINYFPNIYGSLDGVPGGTFNTNELVKKQTPVGKFEVYRIGKKHGKVFADGSIESYQGDNHTFIPSVSALGFYNPNFNWANNIGDRNLVCTNEIPFDAYFTAKWENESHVNISNQAAAWITTEIEKGHIGSDCLNPCGYFLQRTDLPSGQDNVLCNGATYTYQITPSLPIGTIVIWDYDFFQVTNVITTNSSITFNVNYDYQQYTGGNIISCTIVNPCGQNLNYSAGLIAPPLQTGVPILTAGCYIGTQYGIDAIDIPNTTYTWCNDIFGQPNCVFNSPNASCPWNMFSGYMPVPDVSVTLSNVCFTATEIFDGNVPQCQGQKMANSLPKDFAIYPNPSNDNWNISISNALNTKAKISLTDIQGKLLLTQQIQVSSQNSFPISNQNLSSGIYILKINFNNQIQTFKLIKE